MNPVRRGVGATRHPLEVKSQVRILPARQKLFFMNEIINCRFEENCLPDHCADLIIADPPYFQYKGDFDFVWPTFDDYLNNVRRWGEECRRLLKDNGTLIWWGSDNRIAYTQVILDTMFQFLNSCTWNKSNGWGKIQNAEISRKFIPNAERFIL